MAEEVIVIVQDFQEIIAVSFSTPSSGGGGAVDSVNTRTGAVVLSSSDVGLSNILNVDLTPAVDLNTAKIGYTDTASRNAINLTSDSSSLNYNNTTGVFTYTDPTGSPGAASHMEIEVRNTTGSTIPANSAVYISGVSGNNDLIALAVNTGTNPAMGVTTSSINHNSNGVMIIGGEISSFNTSAYSENDTLYLSNTAGQLTNVRPSAETQFVQNIGRVVRSDNNGTIIVQGAGRANDIPNLDSLHVFIGDTLAPESRQLTYTDILNTPTDTDDLSEGTTNLYYTEARVSANTDVVANTAKVGITPTQAADIVTNNSKISYTDASAVALNTAKVGISTAQASDIVANNAKISFTEQEAVDLNTAKISFPEASINHRSYVRNSGGWQLLNEPFTALTDAANISWSANDDSGNVNATVVLGGNRVLNNPSNMQSGTSYNLLVAQDGTGSRTLTFGTIFKWAGGTAPTLSTAANAVDVFTFIYDGSSLYGSVLQNFS